MTEDDRGNLRAHQGAPAAENPEADDRHLPQCLPRRHGDGSDTLNARRNLAEPVTESSSRVSLAVSAPWLTETDTNDQDSTNYEPYSVKAGRTAGSGRLPTATARPFRLPIVVAGMVALLIVTAAAGFAVGQHTTRSSEQSIAADPPPAQLAPLPSFPKVSDAGLPASPEPAPPAPQECETSISGSVVTSNGQGDTASVVGVILAFQHAYYVARSADDAFALRAEGSAFTDREKLQEGIDTVPLGTTYCVTVVPIGDDRADVTVTEIRPGEQPQEFALRATTGRQIDGTVGLVSLRSAPQ